LTSSNRKQFELWFSNDYAVGTSGAVKDKQQVEDGTVANQGKLSPRNRADLRATSAKKFP